jgi:hypothetical protein
MLVAVYQHNLKSVVPITSIVCPGLGTETGRVPAHEAARQMALAYSRFLNPPPRISWALAYERQFALKYGGDFGCTMPDNIKL